MSSVTKQRSHAGRNVFVFFLVFTILVAGVVIGLSRVFKNKDVTPSIAGYSLYIMDSDRMLDKVPRGSLVLASNDTPSIEKVGKAVLCENVPGVGTSVFWLADVSSKEGQDGVIYTIYQEKNTAITYDVKSKNVVGEATTYYTLIGKVISFMISRFGIVICIGSPIALMIIIELIIAIASSDYEDDDDDDDLPEIEKPSSIDDFLFSGDDSTPLSKEQIEEKPEEKEPEPEPEPEEKEPEPEPETFRRPAEPEQPDEPVTETEPVKETEAEAPAEVRPAPAKPVAAKPKPKPKKRPVKRPETSLEDLVKLMEEQQQKLRDEMNKK